MSLKNAYFRSPVPPWANVGWHGSLLFFCFHLRLLQLLAQSLLYLLFIQIHCLLVSHHRVAVPLSVHALLSSIGIRHCSCQTEVTNHHLAALVNKKIRWLNITVDDITTMQKFDWAKNVVGNHLDVCLLQTTLSTCLYQIFQIVIWVIHYNENVFESLYWCFVWSWKKIDKIRRKTLEVGTFGHLS